ncbi:MAG: NRDE family protein [Ferruginibacter sp.]
MCTVTFIPLKNGIILTSNRDEHIERPVALYPEIYILNNKKLVFPKDTKANGTWFISNEEGDVGIILNGAFQKHVHKTSYRKSRGLILPELFQHENAFEEMIRYDFSGIENFTMILWVNKQLREIRWNGSELYIHEHDPNRAYIWSSVTLYSPAMMDERSKWFKEWIKTGNTISQRSIIDFHTNTASTNHEYGLKIKRSNNICTTSITSVYIAVEKTYHYHKDCIQNIESILEYEQLSQHSRITDN